MGTKAPKLLLTGSQWELVKNLNPKVVIASQLPLNKVARMATSKSKMLNAATNVSARNIESMRWWLFNCFFRKLPVRSADFLTVGRSSKSVKNEGSACLVFMDFFVF